MKKKTNQSFIAPELTTVILESISDGVFTVDHAWRITSFNHAAEKITGVSRHEAIGRHCCEVFRANICETDCALRRTMKQGVPFVDASAYIVNSRKEQIPVTVCTSLLRDEAGKVIGGVETFRDMSLVEELRRELDGRYRIGDIVSRSASMGKIHQILPRIALSDSIILIQGETGTGKELVARAIHDLSSRKEGPFFAINCGALPDTLLESELFGYKAGAFTDAVKEKPGYFKLAQGGTIFLDEIGDVSAAFQVRLLRVLQEKTYLPLGGVKPVRTDARVIAATNKDLKTLVAQGIFREDLFYRIHVVQIDIPPLRDRKNDIPVLVDHFIQKRNKLQKKMISGISAEAMDCLMRYDYPGNVRELENMIEYAFILCSENQIGPHCLPDQVSPSLKAAGGSRINARVSTVEAEIILEALKRNHYNRLAAARELGIHKSTLFRKIKKLGIDLSSLS